MYQTIIGETSHQILHHIVQTPLLAPLTSAISSLKILNSTHKVIALDNRLHKSESAENSREWCARAAHYRNAIRNLCREMHLLPQRTFCISRAEL